MGVYLIGRIYRYDFTIDGRRYTESTGKTSKQAAQAVERKERQRLESGYGEVVRQEELAQGRRTIKEAADAFLEEYTAKHRAPTFAKYALGHVTRLVGDRLVSEVIPSTVKKYQTDRLKDKASPKSVNDEVAMLLRLCGDQGELIRSRLRREKALKLKVDPRDAEIKTLIWSQIDFGKLILTVGRSKTDAGAGRTIPLNGTILDALVDHKRWYTARFGEPQPDWFVFPGGGRSPKDPTVPITSFKTAWTSVREKAGVKGRWHDNRHTLITELGESGAGDETIMAIAGHVSKQMLAHYSHIRTEAKRRALGDVERKRAADKEQRKAAEAGETSEKAIPTNSPPIKA